MRSALQQRCPPIVHPLALTLGFEFLTVVFSVFFPRTLLFIYITYDMFVCIVFPQLLAIHLSTSNVCRFPGLCIK